MQLIVADRLLLSDLGQDASPPAFLVDPLDALEQLGFDVGEAIVAELA